MSDPFPYTRQEAALIDWNKAAYPKWFTWLEWGYGIGSDNRYKPRWYERRAYVEGLQDAARIVEERAWRDEGDTKCSACGKNTPGNVVRVEGFGHMRAAIILIHQHTMRFMRSVYAPEL